MKREGGGGGGQDVHVKGLGLGGMMGHGSKSSFFFQKAQLHLQKLLKGVMYRKQFIFGLPRKQKIEGAAGEFKGTLDSWLQLLSSPEGYCRL